MNLHRRSVTFQLLLNPRFGGLAFSGLMLPLLNLCITELRREDTSVEVLHAVRSTQQTSSDERMSTRSEAPKRECTDLRHAANARK